jgi:hypothetical protein
MDAVKSPRVAAGGVGVHLVVQVHIDEHDLRLTQRHLPSKRAISANLKSRRYLATTNRCTTAPEIQAGSGQRQLRQRRMPDLCVDHFGVIQKLQKLSHVHGVHRLQFRYVPVSG